MVAQGFAVVVLAALILGSASSVQSTTPATAGAADG
jgi:hypothetical protein